MYAIAADSQSVVKIDALTLASTGSINLGVPNLRSISISGSQLWYSYGANGDRSGRIGRYDLNTGQNNTNVLSNRIAFYEPILRVSPALPDTVFVTEMGLSPANIERWNVPVGGTPTMAAKTDHGPVGSNIGDFEISDDGTKIWTSSGAPYGLVELNTSDLKTTGRIFGDVPYPTGVASFEGTLASGTNSTYNKDLWIFGASTTATQSFETGTESHPGNVAVSGNMAYSVNGQNFTSVNRTTGTSVQSTIARSRKFIEGVAVHHETGRVFVATVDSVTVFSREGTLLATVPAIMGSVGIVSGPITAVTGPAPTTLAPTTLAPTTLAPTTLTPTTLPPTTLPLTTLAPTTLAPTTLVPTTLPTELTTNMYAIAAGSKSIVKIDPLTLQATGSINLGVANILSISISNSQLWYSYGTTGTFYGKVGRYDLNTGQNNPNVLLGSRSGFYSPMVRTSSALPNTVFITEMGVSPANIERWNVPVTGTPTLAAQTDHGPVGSNIGDFEISADGSKIWTSSGAPYGLVELNTSDLKTTGQIFGEVPSPTGVASFEGTLVSGTNSSNDKDLWIFGAATTATQSFETGTESHPGNVAISNNMAYSVNGQNLTTVNLLNGSTTATPLSRSARFIEGIAVNHATGRVFVATANSVSAFSREGVLLATISGITGSVGIAEGPSSSVTGPFPTTPTTTVPSTVTPLTLP
jgi:hypothetical protein